MRAALVTFAVVATLGAQAAAAAEWDNIRPGESTQATVRTQFGGPTKVVSQKIEGYDSVQWIYEGDQAPRGMKRTTVDFGLLTPQGYRADVVRMMHLEPRPGIFTRATVLAGWGEPDVAETAQDGTKRLLYRSGLWVDFDKEGWNAERMYFTPPQPAEAATPPRR